MYAVIDLGSNSFHLLVARWSGEQLSVVERRSEKVQLADGLARNGMLSAAAMDRGIECLRAFRERMAGRPIAAVRVAATEALRRARNRDVFLARAAELGLDVEVISGPEEAALVFRGICHALPPLEGNRLTVDIGGASTELAVGNEREILAAESLELGCVSWRDRFFRGALDYRWQSPTAKAAAREALDPILPTFKHLQWREAFTASGTAKMLWRIGLANHWSEGPITRDSLAQMENAIAPVRDANQLRLPGLKKPRRDLLAPGLSIMDTVMELLQVDEFHYSSSALREGVMADLKSREVASG